MAEGTNRLKSRIIPRHGTAAQWLTSDPVLSDGEAGIETDTRRVKFGDGASAWSDLTYSDQAVRDLISAETQRATAAESALAEASNFQLFVDLWKGVVGKYGTYNEDTGFFELNGLTDITFEDALTIYNLGKTQFPYMSRYPRTSNLRTNIMMGLVGSSGMSLPTTSGNFGNQDWEVVRVSPDSGNIYQGLYVESGNQLFYSCPKLRKILGVVTFTRATQAGYTLQGSPLLESFKFGDWHFNLDIHTAPNVDLASFQFLIQYRVSASVLSEKITVRVHPTIYAKIIDENNTEWHALIENGAANNIVFTT